MTLRTFLATLMLIALSGYLTAQVNVGFRFGYAKYNAHGEDGLEGVSDQFDPATSSSFALHADAPISEVLSLRTGLEYSRRGTELKLDRAGSVAGVALPIGASAKARFSYLDVPVLLQYTAPTNSLVKPYAFAGASLGYAVSGNLRTTARAIVEFNLMTQDIDLEENNYERFHLAAIGGIGASAQLSTNIRAFAEFRYDYGLSQPYDVPLINDKVGFRGFNLGGGVAFAL